MQENYEITTEQLKRIITLITSYNNQIVDENEKNENSTLLLFLNQTLLRREIIIYDGGPIGPLINPFPDIL